MLICTNCGNVISEKELNADTCVCGGYFEEAVKCDCCEEYRPNSAITREWRYDVGVCSDCIKKYKGKYERVYNKLTLNGLDEFVDWLVGMGL